MNDRELARRRHEYMVLQVFQREQRRLAYLRMRQVREEQRRRKEGINVTIEQSVYRVLAAIHQIKEN